MARKNRHIQKCLTCGKEFSVTHGAFLKKTYKNCSMECRGKYRFINPLIHGKNNSQWKGNNINYRTLHCWVRRQMLPDIPDKCPKCGKKTTKRLMNVSNKGKYNRDLNNWEWLCHHCNIEKDGNLASRDKSGRFKPKSKKIPYYKKKFN